MLMLIMLILMLIMMMMLMLEQMEPVMVEVQRPSREEPRVEGRMVKVGFIFVKSILYFLDGQSILKCTSYNQLKNIF